MNTVKALRSDPKDALYLALDQGGSGTRATVYDRQGLLISTAQRSVSTARPQPGYVEQDPAELIDSLLSCSNRAVVALSHQQQQRLCGWGLACQRSNLVGWDRSNGQPLTPVISWQDNRAERPNRWSDSEIALIRQHCGLYPSHHHGATKIRWCVDHIGTVAAAATDQRLILAPLACYLAQKLITLFSRQQNDNIAVDESSAQRTLLWNHQQRRWDKQLLGLFAIDRQWLPPLRPCLADWGTLRLNSQLSLPGRFVGGDQGCAHLGSGRSQPDTLKVNLGTGGFISLATTNPAQPPEGLLLSLVSSDNERQQWMLEGTINGVGSALEWLQRHETSLNQTSLTQIHQPGQNRQPYQDLHQGFHQDPGLFINSVSGLGSPFWRSDIAPCFIGSTTADQRYSAVMESILFLIQIHIDRLEQAGYPIKQLELSGGVSQIQGLPQRLADLTGKTVQQQSTEMTSRGLAYLIAGRPPQWPASNSKNFPPSSNPSLRQRFYAWCRHLQRQLTGIDPRSD